MKHCYTVFFLLFFSINIRYHGFFILFVIGVLILKNRDFKIYLKSTTYTILLTLVFIFQVLFGYIIKKFICPFMKHSILNNSLSGAYQQKHRYQPNQ